MFVGNMGKFGVDFSFLGLCLREALGSHDTYMAVHLIAGV